MTQEPDHPQDLVLPIDQRATEVVKVGATERPAPHDIELTIPEIQDPQGGQQR